MLLIFVFLFQAEDGIRDLVRSRGLGDVYKRQEQTLVETEHLLDRLLVVGILGHTLAMLDRGAVGPVSYTHLTLPTIYSV